MVNKCALKSDNEINHPVAPLAQLDNAVIIKKGPSGMPAIVPRQGLGDAGVQGGCT